MGSSRPQSDVETQQVCSLLTEEQNQRLSLLVGPSSKILSSAQTDIYTLGMDLNWTRQHKIVLSILIKDSQRRAYYIQVYNLQEMRLLLEIELPPGTEYSTNIPFFHTTQNKESRSSFNSVGLRFHDDDQAASFGRAVQEYRHRRENKKKRTENTNGIIKQESSIQAVGSSSPKNHNESSYLEGGSLSPTPGKKSKRKKKMKIKKEHIGTPTGFKHITHIGFDPYKEDPKISIEERLQGFFHIVGSSELQNLEPKGRSSFYNDENEGYANTDTLMAGTSASSPGPILSMPGDKSPDSTSKKKVSSGSESSYSESQELLSTSCLSSTATSTIGITSEPISTVQDSTVQITAGSSTTTAVTEASTAVTKPTTDSTLHTLTEPSSTITTVVSHASPKLSPVPGSHFLDFVETLSSTSTVPQAPIHSLVPSEVETTFGIIKELQTPPVSSGIQSDLYAESSTTPDSFTPSSEEIELPKVHSVKRKVYKTRSSPPSVAPPPPPKPSRQT